MKVYILLAYILLISCQNQSGSTSSTSTEGDTCAMERIPSRSVATKKSQAGEGVDEVKMVLVKVESSI